MTGTPAYMQIVVFLREKILTGEYPDGKIPQTSALARRFTYRYVVNSAPARVLGRGEIVPNNFQRRYPGQLS
jgi:hypothetical protein